MVFPVNYPRPQVDSYAPLVRKIAMQLPEFGSSSADPPWYDLPPEHILQSINLNIFNGATGTGTVNLFFSWDNQGLMFKAEDGSPPWR